jgi:hypothetical protein
MPSRVRAQARRRFMVDASRHFPQALTLTNELSAMTCYPVGMKIKTIHRVIALVLGLPWIILIGILILG